MLLTALSRLAAEGVILIKANPSQSAKYWTPYAFSKIEQFASAYSVTFANGRVISWRPDEVGGILESPKWGELFALSDADWAKLKKQRDDFATSTAQLPQLKDWASAEIAKFDELLNSRSSSNVLYRGRLIAKEEFDKLSGNTSSPPSSSTATLTVGGKQFTNVKVLSIKAGRLGFSHDGGVGGVPISDLDEKQIEWVKSNAPKLYEDHLKATLPKMAAESENSKVPPANSVDIPSTNRQKTFVQDSIMATASKIELLNKNSSVVSQAKNAGSEADVSITDDLSQTFVFVPAGRFTMGSPLDEKGRAEMGENQVEVILSQPFWLAKTEVTQAQWEAVMGTNPSYFKGTNLPVENVNWMAAQGYIAKLNAKQILPSGWKFALPTEAQWEYACRSGEEGPYSAGSMDEVGWYRDNSGMRTHKVGQKKPNAWGLYDMHGNVWEWCADWYDKTLRGGIDPMGPSTGSIRQSRGGSWFFWSEDCRAANRHGFEPGDTCDYLGFRPALVRDEVKMKKVNDSSVELNSTSNAFEIAIKNELFTNSLGMKFIHLPQREIMICIHETRVRDYQVFATEKGLEWEKPGFMQKPDHPAVNVKFTECEAFCKWLSIKEGRNYRLPTDEEWSIAVGLPPESGKNPKEKSEKGDLETYPWGNYYPPNKQDGNFGLTEVARSDNFNYADDGYGDTAPVMSFKPNKFGIFDMGGNVREWCVDWFDEKQDTRVTRGTSYFYLYPQEAYRSSYRLYQKPQENDTLVGFRCVIGSLITENNFPKEIQ